MKVAEIARLLNAELVGNPDVEITGVAPIESAKPSEITFLANRKYERYLDSTQAGCVIVGRDVDISNRKGTFIVCDDAYVAFARLLNSFYGYKPLRAGIASSACVDESAQIDESAHVGEFVYIGKNAKIGKRTTIMPFTYVGDDVEIGDECLIHPSVVILKGTKIGNRVMIQSGSVIGSDGFGYARTSEGKYVKIPQIGRVIIEDDVEIGANVTIDRAALNATLVKRGTKIDNLVQIAHNVEVGEDCAIVAQTGISGSSKVGNRVILAGQTGIAGHISIADDTTITAKSGVGRSVRKPGIYSGIPIYDHKKWLRVSAVVPKLDEMYKRLQALEKMVEELKKQ